jgi:predicted ATPase
VLISVLAFLYVQEMSDGTLKVFAYLLLLEDPSPPPFVCVCAGSA